MLLHGTPVEDVRRQVRRFGKTLRHADNSALEALDFDAPSFRDLAETFMEDYHDVFTGLNSNPIPKFNRSCIAYVTTLMEPLLCYLALSKPALGALHMAMDSWGAFDMIDALSKKQKDNLLLSWDNFKAITGADISRAERPRKFLFYEIRDANLIEEKSPPFTRADANFVKSINPAFEPDKLIYPTVVIALVKGMAKRNLQAQDQVRCIGEFEGSRSAGVLATLNGAAEMNCELSARKMKLHPMRMQTNVGATLQ